MRRCWPAWPACIRPCSIPSNTAAPRPNTICSGLKLRDALVRSRVSLINAVRFTLKSLGYRGAQPVQRFVSQNHCWRDLPADCHPVHPTLTVLEKITAEIKRWKSSWSNAAGGSIRQPNGCNRSPASAAHGAGLRCSSVGDRAALRPFPRRGRVSGLVSAARPERRHGKTTAHQQMRRWVVAHACSSVRRYYILGPFGPACALRQHGERLSGTGSARDCGNTSPVTRWSRSLQDFGSNHEPSLDEFGWKRDPALASTARWNYKPNMNPTPHLTAFLMECAAGRRGGRLSSASRLTVLRPACVSFFVMRPTVHSRRKIS